MPSTDFVGSPAILTVIFSSQRFRCRPSDILRIADGFEAYCFDEACCWIISQLDEGKRPFFGRETANSRTVGILTNLGAEVKHYD